MQFLLAADGGRNPGEASGFVLLHLPASLFGGGTTASSIAMQPAELHKQTAFVNRCWTKAFGRTLASNTSCGCFPVAEACIAGFAIAGDALSGCKASLALVLPCMPDATAQAHHGSDYCWTLRLPTGLGA